MAYDLCRHIKTNGKVCHSPALTGHSFCYFHRKLRIRHRELIVTKASSSQPAEIVHEVVYDRDGYPLPQPLPIVAPSPNTAELDLPLLEDRESVQVAISLVVSAIARNRIDPRRAAAILYGLQLASSNTSHTVTEPVPTSLAPAVARSSSGFDLLPRHLSTTLEPAPAARSSS